RAGRGDLRAHLGGLQFRPHPAVDLVAVVGGGAGQEDEEQHPAHQQAGPGVQPGHRLAEALLHAARLRSSSAPSASTAAGRTMRTAKANTAPQAYTAMPASMPVSTAWLRAIGRASDRKAVAAAASA